MIVENALDRHGYARILLAAHHADEGYTGPKGRVLWSFDTIDLREHLGANAETHGAAFDATFPGLREKMWEGHFNDDYNADPQAMASMTLWVTQGSREELAQAWYEMFAAVKEGPQGADDDTFDYWPSAWGCLLHFTEDLIKLGVVNGTALLAFQHVWDRLAAEAIARDRDRATWCTSLEDFSNEVVPRPILQPQEVTNAAGTTE